MGKPLISDAAMRGMYETMQRLRSVKRDPEITGSLSRGDRTRMLAQPESLYAALLAQMHRRDTLVTEGGDPLAQAALAAYFAEGSAAPMLFACPCGGEESAAFAAGIAMQKRRAAPAQPVVVALLREFPALTGVLQMLEQRDLSLLLIVQGAPESRAYAQRRIMSTKIPILPVDAADAVAVCRVMQECILRARNGWGGAVLHAAALPDAPEPLTFLQQHLLRRGLL